MPCGHFIQRFCLGALCAFAAVPVAACELALVLSVDVSGSVDYREYNIQMQGLADGVRDPVVSEALVRNKAAVAVVQWTGSTRQTVTVPWKRIGGFADVEELARQIETAPRRWRHFSTAIGEALSFSLEQFIGVPDCRNRVIDVSGDGVSNEGRPPESVRFLLRTSDVTVNGLVIEGEEDDLTGYFWENVITGEGAFVETANGFDEYAEKIRLKLRRETTIQLAGPTTGIAPVPARAELD